MEYTNSMAIPRIIRKLRSSLVYLGFPIKQPLRYANGTTDAWNCTKFI